MKSAINLPFRFVKMIDIGYVTAIYFLMALYISTLLDQYFGKFDEKKADREGIFIFSLKCIAHLWLVGVIIYIARNVSELIPSPFHGLAGYDHYRLKELTTAAVFSVVFIMYQKNLKEKLDYIYKYMIKA